MRDVIPQVETPRYRLRPLTLGDVTPRYLSWFAAEGADRIQASGSIRTLQDLQDYVRERIGRDDVLFLGIFDRDSGQHLGNLKYEPINTQQRTAIMGIFIGEVSARGQGLAGEVIRTSAAWLREHRGIRQILLGVETDNSPAIRAYEKLGFRVEATPYLTPMAGCLAMVWTLD